MNISVSSEFPFFPSVYFETNIFHVLIKCSLIIPLYPSKCMKIILDFPKFGEGSKKKKKPT